METLEVSVTAGQYRIAFVHPPLESLYAALELLLPLTRQHKQAMLKELHRAGFNEIARLSFSEPLAVRILVQFYGVALEVYYPDGFRRTIPYSFVYGEPTVRLYFACGKCHLITKVSVLVQPVIICLIVL